MKDDSGVIAPDLAQVRAAQEELARLRERQDRLADWYYVKRRRDMLHLADWSRRWHYTVDDSRFTERGSLVPLNVR